LASESYTLAFSAEAMHGIAQGLVTRGLIGFRQRGLTVLVKPRLFTSAYGEWLAGLGFHTNRAACLFEARAKVHGDDVAQRLADTDTYATPWLNPPPLAGEGDRAAVEGATRTPLSDAERAASEQPELIEASEEEKAARAAQQREAFAEESARSLMRAFSHQTGDWMNFARLQGRSDYLSDSGMTPEALTTEIFRALSVAELHRAVAAIAALHARGVSVYRPTLTQIPVEVVTAVMTTSRAPAEAGAQAVGDRVADDSAQVCAQAASDRVASGSALQAAA
jgi:hypothetical protein